MKKELQKEMEKARQKQCLYKIEQLKKIEQHKKKLKSLLRSIFGKINL